MSPLSHDLRERIVATVRSGRYTLLEIARLFLVNVSTVVRLLQRVRETGSVDAKPHAGGHAVNSMATLKNGCWRWSENNPIPSWPNCEIGSG